MEDRDPGFADKGAEGRIKAADKVAIGLESIAEGNDAEQVVVFEKDGHADAARGVCVGKDIGVSGDGGRGR